MTNLTKSRRQFTALQKQEAVDLCLSEGLSCSAVAQRLGIPISSLSKWVRQARIDRGDFGPPEQGQLTSDERAELAQLRKENRELSDAAGNRWSRLIASTGVTTFRYEARIELSDSSDPVVAVAMASAVQGLPLDTYPLLNPSSYCDMTSLMTFAWDTFVAVPADWGQVQA
jgi:transposase-like protein